MDSFSTNHHPKLGNVTLFLKKNLHNNRKSARAITNGSPTRGTLWFVGRVKIWPLTYRRLWASRENCTSLLTDLPVIYSDLQQVICQNGFCWRQHQHCYKTKIVPCWHQRTRLAPFQVPDGSVVTVVRVKDRQIWVRSLRRDVHNIYSVSGPTLMPISWVMGNIPVVVSGRGREADLYTTHRN
jgi:hypothetical protein